MKWVVWTFLILMAIPIGCMEQGRPDLVIPSSKIEASNENPFEGEWVNFNYEGSRYDVRNYNWTLRNSAGKSIFSSDDEWFGYNFKDQGNYIVYLSIINIDGGEITLTKNITVVSYRVNFGYYQLILNTPLNNGDIRFLYEDSRWNIRISDKVSNESLCVFWSLTDGAVYGIRGFMMEVSNITDTSVDIHVYPDRRGTPERTNFYGLGVFFNRGNEYDLTFGFEGNHSFRYVSYNVGNETGELQLTFENHTQTIYLKSCFIHDLGFTTLWIRHGGAMECQR